NCLLLDYPREKLEVLLATDAPPDEMEKAAWRCSDKAVTVLPSPQHQGKAGKLNSAAVSATGEILVFADVRQQFDRRALRELVANFHDPSVGAVSGELMLMDENGLEAANGIGLYW